MIQGKFDSIENSYNKSWDNLSKRIDKIARIKKLKKLGLMSLLCFGIGLVSIINFQPKDKDSTAILTTLNNKTTIEESIIDTTNSITLIDDLLIKKDSNKKETTTIKTQSFYKNQVQPNYEVAIEQKRITKKEEKLNDIEENILANIENNNVVIDNMSILEITDTAVFISTKNTTFCAEDTLEFLVSSCNNCNLEWYINNKFHSNNTDGKFILSGSGNLSFRLIATKNKDTLISNSVDILIEDISDIKISFQEIIESQNTNHYFSALSSTNLDGYYNWDFGDNTYSEDKNAKKHFKDNGIYIVSLEYTSKMGCIKKAFKSIDVNKTTNLLAPNSFTPNGDGLNDYFMPEGLKISGNTFELNVYNKRGQIVFNSKNVSNAWDGFNQSTGQKCKNDNYIWVVQTTNENGEPEQFKGSIFIFK